jgi:hypothetical protein
VHHDATPTAGSPEEADDVLTLRGDVDLGFLYNSATLQQVGANLLTTLIFPGSSIPAAFSFFLWIHA